MHKLRLIFFGVLFGGCISAPTALAQTAGSITVQSGNGQIICPSCAYSIFRFFLPLVVKLADAAGQPIPSKTVNWNVTVSQIQAVTLAFGATT